MGAGGGQRTDSGLRVEEKSEKRNPKSETNSNEQSTKFKTRVFAGGLRLSAFRRGGAGQSTASKENGGLFVIIFGYNCETIFRRAAKWESN